MKFTRNKKNKGLIWLGKERNLVNQWQIKCPCGLCMDWCELWLASLLLGTQTHFFQHKQLLSGIFFIVGLSSSIEILRNGTFCYKDLKKLSLAKRGIIMSRWRVVENKGIYCLVFLWAVGLIIHIVLYKVFLNKSFGEHFCYINFFVISYCMSYSKKL